MTYFAIAAGHALLAFTAYGADSIVAVTLTCPHVAVAKPGLLTLFTITSGPHVTVTGFRSVFAVTQCPCVTVAGIPAFACTLSLRVAHAFFPELALAVFADITHAGQGPPYATLSRVHAYGLLPHLV